ncbi:hypothetical protein [Microbacterium lacticum]
MSKNARRVTEAEAIGEVDQTPTNDLRRKYEQNVGPVSYIPETILDDLRLEARAATYRNSQEEQAVLAAVDKAIAERVQRAAASHLEQAAHLLENEGAPKLTGTRQTPNALAKADAHLDELAAIRKELREGKTPTAELAARYESVRSAMQARDGHALVALSSRATSLRDRLADPKAAVSKTLSYMPANMWRPLGIRQW